MSTAAIEGEDVRTPATTTGRAARRPPVPRGLLPGLGAALVAAAGGLLAVGCFLGLYLRPTSDDWCAGFKARDLGVLGITADFYTTQNGRVTNAFLSGIVYGDGLTGVKLLPAALVLTLTAGLVLLGRECVRLLGGRPLLLLLTAAALVLQALLYFGGTRTYQVLLWAPATISHTVPAVIGVWALLAGVWTVRQPRAPARTAGFAAALLTGFALGTLSEPFALVSGLLAAGAGLLALPRIGLARDRRPFTWCLLYCAGLLTGLIVLYTSPGARWRRAQQPETASPLSAAELEATFQDWLRMWDTVTGQWAYLGAAAVGVLLGLALGRARYGHAVRKPARGRTVPRPALAALLLLPVPVLLLGSFAVMVGLRSGYGPTGWTYARTWTSHLVLMELALCGYGMLLGVWLGRYAAARPHPGRALLTGAAVATGCLTLASVAVLVPAVRDLTTATVTRAAAWDAQNARIRAETARGATDVGYRPLPIGSLAEPFYTRDYDRDWVAACVSRWYGVDRIHRR
ncbi:DUF6056 family protein [Streptomyces sp. NPDC047014]|uniref:DUF6056 family protein n=1 Tax=Streptomyces sp. NPDC047014 TaxID=3155736 RepID=UPI0033C10B27